MYCMELCSLWNKANFVPLVATIAALQMHCYCISCGFDTFSGMKRRRAEKQGLNAGAMALYLQLAPACQIWRSDWCNLAYRFCVDVFMLHVCPAVVKKHTCLVWIDPGTDMEYFKRLKKEKKREKKELGQCWANQVPVEKHVDLLQCLDLSRRTRPVPCVLASISLPKLERQEKKPGTQNGV